MGLFTELVLVTAGVLIPSFSTFKALKNKTQQNRLIWLRYWVVFSLFYSTRLVTDVFFFWLPFYDLIKILIILWLSSSKAAGAQVLYFCAIEPLLRGHELTIDRFITQSQKQVASIFWAAASQFGLRWSGFIVQIIRLYLEAANQNVNHLSLEAPAVSEADHEQVMDVDVRGDEPDGRSTKSVPRVLVSNNVADCDGVYSDDEEAQAPSLGPLSPPRRITEPPSTPTSSRKRGGKKRTTKNSSKIEWNVI